MCVKGVGVGVGGWGIRPKLAWLVPAPLAEGSDARHLLTGLVSSQVSYCPLPSNAVSNTGTTQTGTSLAPAAEPVATH